MGSPVYPISPSFGGGSGTSDHSLLTNRDAADQHPVTSITGAASKTESDLTLYVYEDATGTGDGSSKANGFTTLQAAIDAMLDVARAVTIIVSKGYACVSAACALSYRHALSPAARRTHARS